MVSVTGNRDTRAGAQPRPIRDPSALLGNGLSLPSILTVFDFLALLVRGLASACLSIAPCALLK
jgi:hypothetical protein